MDGPKKNLSVVSYSNSSSSNNNNLLCSSTSDTLKDLYWHESHLNSWRTWEAGARVGGGCCCGCTVGGRKAALLGTYTLLATTEEGSAVATAGAGAGAK